MKPPFRIPPRTWNAQQRVAAALIVSLLAIKGGFALGSPAGGPPIQARLLTDWYPDPERGGYYCAQLKGYYREAGLEVEILPGGANSAPIQRLLTGRVDFVLSSSGDTLVQVGKGLPVVAVAAAMQHDPQAILVHAGSPVRRFEDLDGRTVAVSPGAFWIQYVQKRYQLRGVRELPASLSIASFLTDTNGITQCFVTSEPYFAREAGVETRTLRIEDEHYQPYRVIVTTRDFLNRRPEVVRAFVEASRRGWSDYLAHPNEVNVELKRLNPELNTAKMNYSWRALKEGRFISGDLARGDRWGGMDDRRWKSEYEILKDLKLIKTEFDYHQAFDTHFCNATP